jgi:hypothetical protein
MGAETLKQELETLERLLAHHGESGPAQMIRAALGIPIIRTTRIVL